MQTQIKMAQRCFSNKALKCLYPVVMSFVLSTAGAQTSPLRIHPNIVLPKDSLDARTLLSSLNGFLAAAQKPNEENSFICDSERLETFVLADELKDITKDKHHNDDDFYKPYLENVTPLGNHRYRVHFAYIGVDSGLAFLRAGFELLARPAQGGFVFSSPLISNTQHWKTTRIGTCTFHYQSTLNKEKATRFSKMVADYDARLGAAGKQTELYCCKDLAELQQLTGVIYKSDYNGWSKGVWISILGDRKLSVLGNGNAGFDDFDPHDLWHERLALVTPRSKLNRAVDEGCAYLYGGSWGLSWTDVFKAFREQVASNKSTDWADVKEHPLLFKTKEFNNAADYIVNALLVKKIEAEHGFAGVWELLNSGPAEAGNERYYAALQKLTGITREGYNSAVWALINKE